MEEIYAISVPDFGLNRPHFKRIHYPKLACLSFYVEHDYRDWYDSLFRESALGFEGGMGFLWKPIEQMSLSLRQGITVSFYENDHERPDHEVQRFSIELVEPEFVVLVYF